MSTELFQTQTIAGLVTNLPRKPGFLSSFFSSKPQNIHPTDIVELHDKNDLSIAAPYCQMSAPATPFAFQGYSSSMVKIPHMRLSDNITAIDAMNRLAGEGINSALSPQQRAGILLMEKMENLFGAIDISIEAQAAQVFTTGKVVIKGADIDAEVDYQRNPLHNFTLTGAALWNTPTGTPSVQFDLADQLIRDNGRKTVTDVILGSGAFAALVSNVQTLNFLDNRRLDPGILALRPELYDGATYRGNLYGLNIWVYSNTYSTISPTGVVSPTRTAYIPNDSAVFFSSAAINEMHYAPVMELEGANAVARFAKTFVVQDPSSRVLVASSRPLAVTRNPNAFVTIKVI